MTHLSFTGKRWSTPVIITDEDPYDSLMQIAALRDLGDDAPMRTAWMDAATYPMAHSAAARLKYAATHGETIGIIGDYDCDGLTSTAILVRIIRRLGAEPIVRLPHRLREGYGVQMAHIEEMHAQNVTLLLTTDTGIVATQPLEKAKQYSIDVIVLDHHAYEEAPPAFAILHPRGTVLQSSPAAAGIALTFAHAVYGQSWDDRETDLALGAIGTIADVVPLTHENRSIVREGLRAIAALSPSSGIGYLREKSNIGMSPVSSDIAYRMAPRLNAAGRLDDATIGLRALLGDRASVDALETLNAERQCLTRTCMEEALTMIDSENLPACVCVASQAFPKGIIGLISGKLTERFGRPSAAIAIHQGLCTASLRSVPGYNIADGLRRHAHLLTTFGGHELAGGCSFAEERLTAFTQAMNEDVCHSVDMSELHPTVQIDAQTSINHVSLPLTDALASLEPFGCANMEPLFLLPSVSLLGLRRVGTDRGHLQARVQGQEGTVGIIGFGLGHVCEHIDGPVDLACRITSNEWNEKRSVQLSLVDVRAAAQTGASLPSISKTAMTGTLSAEAIL